MKKNVMKKWVKALRSGKYEQGARGYLYHPATKTHCCLGVLCEISKVNTNDKGYLDKDQMEATGISSADGKLPKAYKVGGKKYGSLAELNDNGLSFKRIARIIEKNWEKL